MGSYRQQGGYLGAVFSLHGQAFFRPTLWALNIPWNLLLPPEPLAYHLRNAVFVLLELLLFHRILLRLVTRRPARALALAAAAVSRVHFATIGYAASFSTILVTLLTMGALLCLLRDSERPNRGDRAAALALAVLLIFSKDYGMTIALLLAAASVAVSPAAPDWRAAVRKWVLPCSLAAAAYLAIRWALVPPLPDSSPYRPVLDVALIAGRLVRAFGSLANLSLTSTTGVLGSRGLAGLFPEPWVPRLEIAMAIAFAGLLLASFRAARPPRALVLLPVTWGLVYFGPTLLSRNEQAFYLNDLAFGFALLVGFLADRLGSAGIASFTVFVVLAAANAGLGNLRSYRLLQQDWIYTAARTAPAVEAARHLRGRGMTTLAVITREPQLFNFALTADGFGPMLPEVAGDPNLTVFVAPRESVVAAPEGTRDAGIVFLDADASFAEMAVRWKAPPADALKLVRLYPATVTAGAPFHPQPGGDNALGVAVENAVRGCQVRVDGRDYRTVFGDGHTLSINLPPALTAVPGRHTVQLVHGERLSNRLYLVVVP